MKKILVFIASLLLAASAVAEEGIVYVDLDRVYRESQQIEEERKKINAAFSDRQQALETAGGKIRGLLDDLEKDAPTLSDEEQEEKRKEITDVERNFLRDQRALAEDRNLRLQELRRVINSEISRIINEISAARGYKIVLNPFFVLPLSNERTFTHNIILYAADETNITDDVVAEFDKSAKLGL